MGEKSSRGKRWDLDIVESESQIFKNLLLLRFLIQLFSRIRSQTGSHFPWGIPVRAKLLEDRAGNLRCPSHFTYTYMGFFSFFP